MEGTPTKILFDREPDPDPIPPKDSSDLNGPESGGPTPWKKYFKWTLIGGSSLFLIGILCVVGFVIAVRQGVFGPLPNTADLRAIRTPVASQVYGADGALLGKFYLENRTNVDYNDMSANLIQALVATEDARFFKHKGVDTKSYFRVLLKTVLMGNSSSGGGSTLGQQLIKNLYKRADYGFFSIPVWKAKEAIIARRLSEVYTKEDILALYLNTVSFGEDVFGISTASERFFDTNPKDIKLEEAAVLIGMLKAPTRYSPRRYPERSKGRRNIVLDQMVKQNYLSASQAKKLKQKPLELKYSRRSQSEGPAPHFRDFLKGELKAWSEENPRVDGNKYNIYTDGLKIYTTIDSRLQKHAVQAVKTHMANLQGQFDSHWKSKGQQPWGYSKSIVEQAKKRSERYRKLKKAGKTDKEINTIFLRKRDMRVYSPSGDVVKNMSPKDSLVYYLNFLNTGFTAVDPQTGAIKAWVGSVNHTHFPYDHVEAKRQVGSTFKPIVYATALKKGADPCKYYSNELRNYVDHQNWTPQNSDGEYGGFYSLQGALANSVNTVSVQVIMEAGVANVIEFARELGIENDIPEVPSITLGTADLSPKEMVSAYCTFANGGKAVKPFFLSKITNSKGKVLADYTKRNNLPKKQILDEAIANQMVQMLRNVVDSGTARRLHWKYGLSDADLGGKTGTTQNQTDGWFMGISPDIVVGAWVGGSDRRVRFDDIKYGQGANMALPIAGEFWKSIYKDPSFSKWKSKRFFEEESDSLLLASMNCNFFKTDTTSYREPVEVTSVPRTKGPKFFSTKGKPKGPVLNPKTKAGTPATSKNPTSKPKRKRFRDRLKDFFN